MIQLTTEQITFVVETFHETGSLRITRDRFGERFPDRQPRPVVKTFWANVRKFSQHGIILNRNKGNSGGRRTGRSEANSEAVRQQLDEHPTGTSAWRNSVDLSHATFNRITRLDLKLHPYRMHIRHQLLPQDYARRMQFARWLVDRCARNEKFLRPFVNGDEAGLAMNGTSSKHSER